MQAVAVAAPTKKTTKRNNHPAPSTPAQDGAAATVAVPAPAPSETIQQVMSTFNRAHSLGRYGHSQCVKMTADLLELSVETVMSIVPPRKQGSAR